jgi:hypothetical protein
MNNELERIWKEAVRAYFKTLSWHLPRMRKIMKNLSQDSQSPGRDLNLGPPKYVAVSRNVGTEPIGVHHMNLSSVVTCYRQLLIQSLQLLSFQIWKHKHIQSTLCDTITYFPSNKFIVRQYNIILSPNLGLQSSPFKLSFPDNILSVFLASTKHATWLLNKGFLYIIILTILSKESKYKIPHYVIVSSEHLAYIKNYSKLLKEWHHWGSDGAALANFRLFQEVF